MTNKWLNVIYYKLKIGCSIIILLYHFVQNYVF